MPAEARAELPPAALAWFEALGRGEYVGVTPVLSGSNTVGTTFSVTAPADGTPPAIPRVRPAP